MTINRLLLRNAALCVPVSVGLGVLWSWDHAVAALISCLVVVVNLWVLSILGPRVVMSLSKQQNPTFWMALLGLKFIVLACVLIVLVRGYPPVGVALGFVPLVLGGLITGIELGLEEERREAQRSSTFDPESKEA